MNDDIAAILKRHSIFSHLNEGILVVKVKDSNEGLSLANDILGKIIDPKTILYVSGGRTPKELYEEIAADEKIVPGAVGLIDERFGEKWHQNSNEKMIKDTGLLRYLQMRDITFYPILHPDISPDGTAQRYDETIRSLNNVYHKSVGILGVGLDGHTAGIAGNRHDFQNPMFEKEKERLMVSAFNDKTGMYKERVTMTFLGLSMLDYMVVLVFGDDKKEALEKMFADGADIEIPSRIFKNPDIARKTLLITDQQI